MRLANFVDVKNHVEGKIVAVLVAFTMIFAFSHAEAWLETAFADDDAVEVVEVEKGSSGKSDDSGSSSASQTPAPAPAPEATPAPDPKPAAPAASDQQTGDDSSANKADSSKSESQTYVVTVKADNAKVMVEDKAIDKTTKIKEGKDFKFTVAPAAGYSVTSVKMENSKGKKDLVMTNGEYVVLASGISENFTIHVEAEADKSAAEPATKDNDEDDSKTSETENQSGSTEQGDTQGAEGDQQGEGEATDAQQPADEPETEAAADANQGFNLFDFFGILNLNQKEATMVGGQLDETADYTVLVGNTVTITGTKGKYSNSWTTSDSKIATVSGSNGNATVKGVKGGTVTITNTYKDKWNGASNTQTFTVKVTEPTVDYLDIIQESESIYVGDKLGVKLDVVVDPADAKVTWASSNTSVATVDADGNVKGLKAGTVTITATAGDKSDTCEVEVKATTGKTLVYVYVNAANLASYSFPNLTVNGNGWYTVGYLVYDTAPTATSNGSGNKTNITQSVKDKLGSITRWSANTSIPTSFLLDIVTQYNLFKTSGATDYVGGSTSSWHMDLYAPAQTNTYPVTVNYIDEGTGKVMKTVSPKYGYGATVEAGWYNTEKFSGYTFGYADKDSLTVSGNASKDVLNLYYKKNGSVVVSIDNKTVPFNGDQQSVNAPKITGGPADITLEGLHAVASGGVGTNVGDYAATVTGDAQYVSGGVTYDVVYRGGNLKITPAPVTVTIEGATDTKPYDGSAHTVSGYTVTNISDPSFTEAMISFDGAAQATRTKVGTTDMGLTAAQFSSTNGNYAVTFNVTDGWMQITAIEETVVVVIEGAVVSAPYDGQSHTASGYTVKSISNSNYTAADFSFNGPESVSRTAVGSDDMGLKNSQFQNTNTNYKNVEFQVTDGSVTITPANVVVSVKGDQVSTTYDGQPHTASGYEIVSVSDSNYDTSKVAFSGTATAARTNVGTTEMGLSESQFSNTDANYSVTFQVEDGFVDIDPVAEPVVVTITGNHKTVFYNGEEQSVSGYTVSSSNPKYTDKMFEFSGEATASKVFKGTENMNLTASQFRNISTNFTNVTFQVIDGYITINPLAVTVTIKGHTDSQVYNGSEQGVEGYDVTISNNMYTEAEFTHSGSAVAKRTDVGTTGMGLSVEQFSNKNNNYDVTFQVTDGYMNITPVTDEVVVTITGNSDSKPYNGEAQSVEGYTVESTNPLYGESSIQFSGEATASQTNVGSQSMGLTEEMFSNTNPNFTNVKFEVVDGGMTIEPLAITVQVEGNTDTQGYNGQPQSVTGYEVTNLGSDLYSADSIEFSGDAIATQTIVGTKPMGLAETQFSNTDENFAVTFQVTDGSMTITPVTDQVVVTIVGNSDSKPYNGEAQSVEGYEITGISNDLYAKGNVKFEGEAVASQTAVGSQSMGLAESQFSNTNANFTNVKFQIIDGSMTVTPLAITVQIAGNTDSQTYNGEEQSVTGYEVINLGSDLYSQDSIQFTGDATAARTDVGTQPMNLTESQFSNSDENFTVTFQVADGSMTITPVQQKVVVKVKGNTGSEVYDAQEHGVSGYEITGISNPLFTKADVIFSGQAIATKTTVGTEPMNLTQAQFSAENTNFANVEFEVTDGSMTILPKVVTVSAIDNGKVYGESDPELEASVQGVVDDFQIQYNVERKAGEDVGEYDINVTAAKTQGNYQVVTEDGTFTITKADEVIVYIKGNTDSQIYNGQPQSVEGYEVTSISNALYTENDFTFNGQAVAAQTAVGSQSMGLSESQFVNNNTNFESVRFEVTDGSMTVTPLAITVEIAGNTDTQVYNGQPQSVEGYEVTSLGSDLYSADSIQFSGDAVASQTTVGTKPMGLSESQFSNTDENFEVTFVVADGSMTITPVTDQVVVTIAGNSDSQVFNGQAQSVTGYEVTEISNDLFTKNDIQFTGTAVASQTNVGSKNMGLTEGMFSNTNVNFSNVKLEVADGSMTVTPLAITVEIAGNTDTQVYNGQPQSVEGYEVTSLGSDLYSQNAIAFDGDAIATQTNVGSMPMGLAESQFSNTDENFKVTFVVTDGSMTITPVAQTVVVKIAGNSDSQVFNGSEQSISGYQITDISNSLFTENDIQFTGEAVAAQTNVGSKDMGLTEDMFASTNSNFASVKFEVVDGAMTITPLAVTVEITGNSDTQTYNGSEQSISGYEVTSISDSLFTEDDIQFTGSAVAARTDVGAQPMNLTQAQFSTENKNFTVTFQVTDGSMTINPVTTQVLVSIKGDQVTEVYNGEKHTASGYEVGTITNPLYNAANIAFDGQAIAEQTNVGTDEMGLTADMFSNTNPNFTNVKFQVIDGFAKVTPLAVTVDIKGNTDSKPYNGSEQAIAGYEIGKISSDLYSKGNVQLQGEAIAKRTIVGTQPMNLTADSFKNTDGNFTVTFQVTDGSMTITPVAETVVVKIAGNTDSQVFNGSEQSVEGYEVTEISNPLYAEENIAFDGEAVAARTNVGSQPMGLAESQFSNKNVNFASVKFEVTDGSMTVTPLAVVVKVEGNTDSQVYNGQPQSIEGYEISEISSDLYDEASVELVGGAVATQTNVGTQPMNLTADSFKNNDENFTVTFQVTDGSMTITPVTDQVVVTIVGNSDSQVFNGQAHDVSGYEVTGISNDLFTENDIQFAGEAAASQTVVGTKNMNLTEGMFSNTNANFTNVKFEVTDGSIEVTPLAITVQITGNSDSQVYNGEPQSVTGYEVTDLGSNLYSQNAIAFEGDAIATQTNVGSMPMGLAESQFFNTDENFTVTFQVTDGSMTITPVTDQVVVTIVGNTDSKPYNGSTQSVSGYEITDISNPLFTKADVDFDGTAIAAQTNVGTKDMGLTEDMFSNTNANFSNVKFEVIDGSMTIEPLAITVKIAGNTDSQVYNGQPQSVEGYEVTDLGIELYDEDSIEFTGEAVATKTTVGTEPMNLTQAQFSNTDENFKVTFVVADGSMTITPVTETVVVKIAGNTDSQTYNASEQFVQGYEVTSISNSLFTENDIKFSGQAEASRTNVGTEPMNLTESQFSTENPNFASVKFEVADGSMTITPKAVTVSAIDNGKVFGQKDPALEASVQGVVDDFQIQYGVERVAGEDVGEYDINVTAEKTQGNYTVATQDGTFTITKADEVMVYIKGQQVSATYNGEKHEAVGYEVTNISNSLYTEADFTFNGTASVDRIDAGKDNMGLTEDMFVNNSTNFKKVTFVVTDGWVDVAPLAVDVTIRGHKDSKPYNGSEQSVQGYDFGASSALYAEANVAFDGTAVASQTIVGTKPMGLATSQFSNTNPNFTVSFQVFDGSMAITPVAETVVVKVEGNTDSQVYNGQPHSVSGYEITDISNPLFTKADVKFSGKAEATRTNVGTEPMNLTESQFSTENPNFASVKFEVVDGGMTITPVTETVVVTIVGNSDSRVFNGLAHDVQGYEVTSISNSLFTENDIQFNGQAAASQTNVGTKNMNLSETMFAGTNPNFASVKFEITDGSIEVTPLAITVKIEGNTDIQVYNGSVQSITGYEVTDLGSDLYDEESIQFDGQAVASQDVVGTKSMDLTADMFSNTDGNFTVTFDVTDGWMKITPVTETVVVTIVGNSDSKTYNGQAHDVAGYEITDISNPLFTKADVKFAGTAAASQTNVGTDEMGLTEAQFSTENPNFASVKFEVTDGSIEVTPLIITVEVEGNTDTKTYDGQPHDVSGYVVTDLGSELYSENAIAFDGTAAASQTVVGTKSMNLTADMFSNTDDNFIVTFQVTDGWVKVIPIDEVVVTITGHKDSKPYNGDQQSVQGYDVAISNDLYTENDFTFNGEAVAAQTDVGTQPMGLTSGQFQNTNGNFAKVTFEVTDGSMKVTPLPITVQIAGNTDSQIYNGSEQSIEGYEVTDLGSQLYSENAIQFDGQAVAAQTNVGKDYMDLTKDMFSNTDDNFTVTFQVTDGWMEVTPVTQTVEVTIVGNNDTQTYNGKVHSVSGYKITSISNPLFTEADVNFAGAASPRARMGGDYASRANVGTSYMGLAESQFSTENPNFSSVQFKVTDGYITIEPLAITVKVAGNTDTQTYNGKEQGISGYEVTDLGSQLYSENAIAFDGQAVAKATNVGTENMNLTNEMFSNTDDNFTVTFEVTDGSMTIEPRAIEVTALSDSKTYDESALTAEATGYKISKGTLADNQNETVVLEGSQTLVGESAATVSSVTIKDAEGNDVTANYDISTKDGKLAVTKGSEDEPVDPTLVATKSHDNDLYYMPGQKVTFTITAKNIFDAAATIELTELEGVSLDQAIFENVAPGETVTTTATYKVTKADVKKGSFENIVTARLIVGDDSFDTEATDVVENLYEPKVDIVPGTSVDPIVDVLEDAVDPIDEVIHTIIGDDDNPAAGFDAPHCWVHYYMILGILITLAYGLGVAIRRGNQNRRLQQMEEIALGINSTDEAATAPVNPIELGKEA